MTQVVSINRQRDKRARVILGALEGQGPYRWEPTREELLQYRRMSRANYTARMAYDEAKPDCAYNTFQTRTKNKYAIIWSR